MKYAQFCPIAKASEVIGERWMLHRGAGAPSIESRGRRAFGSPGLGSAPSGRPPKLTRNLQRWLRLSRFAATPLPDWEPA